MNSIDAFLMLFGILGLIAIAILIFMYTPKGKRWLKDL